ncbi:MAG: DNA polymerase III subunit beta [Armatimonadota bacterium]
MRVICSRKELQEGVQTVARAVSSRTSLPILGNILIKTEDSKLRLVAYDLEIGMEHILEATVQEPGALTIPARVVSDIIATLPDTDIQLSTDQGGMVNLKCGTSDFSILGSPAEEFPMLPEVAEEVRFKVGSGVLREGIAKTIFAVSSDESRVILTGILLQVTSDGLKLVSTDTHRLCVCECAISDCQGAVNVIVPARAMQEVNRIAADGDGEVQVVISQSQVKFSSGDTVLVSRLIEGQFPNFEKVIPAEFTRKLIIPSEQFTQAMRRVEIVARESSQKTIFNIEDGTLVLTAECASIGRAHEEVEVIKEGEDIKMAFNAKYILDFMGVVDTEAVEVELSGQISPALIKPQGRDDYIYVLMPMHLD